MVDVDSTKFAGVRFGGDRLGGNRSRRWGIACGALLILVATHAWAGPKRRATTDVAPKEPPPVAVVGQAIDRSVPAFQPKFLARPPLAGRFEERSWAYFNTYPAYPLYGYGYWGCGYGYYGGGFAGFGEGACGYGWGGTSLQTVGYTR